MSFQKTWSRVRGLSWDEIRTRAGQEVGKRMDLARYRLGSLPRGEPIPARSPAPSAAAFFFGSDEISHRAELLRHHLPEEAANIVREADEICRHEFRLLGYEPLDYGAEIDWHLDAVHGKRAPLKPWFKIDFLNFAEVGDHKITWELNRHQHLVTLAKAWCLTSNRDYLVELASQWYAWQKANPYPLGINWASTLEVAFRSLSWLWVRHLLAGGGDLPPNFPGDLLVALRQNGRYIERYLSTYFSPNTHLLGEAVALFFIATLLPELPEAARWQKVSWRVVVEEAERQVRADGVYFEQALYYHVYALDFFLHARMLAARNGIVVPAEFDGVVAKMLHVLRALSRGGAIEGFGDDDGGRVFNSRRNRVEHMTDPLALGAIEYKNAEWAAGARLTEEAVWLFGDDALTLSATQSPQATVGAKAFEAGGIYLMWDDAPFPQQMMIDAGPLGNGNCGHGHADALSVRFSLDGARYLVDPGAYCYISKGNERAEFRGTGAHNTLRVDSLDQAVPAGPFAWTSLPETGVEQWLSGETFSLFEGSHDGYRRLADPVVHRRIVFHVRGAFWLVRDVVEGKRTHLFETMWHFGPTLAVRERAGALIASLADPASPGEGHDVGLALLVAPKQAWKAEIVAGEVSPAYGAPEPAPVVRLSATTQLPAESCVLLLPFAAGAVLGEFAQTERGAEGVKAYTYSVQQTAHYLFFADRSQAWSCAAWSSDARVLYCRLKGGRLEQMVLVGGSFAKWQDKTVVAHRGSVERFELTKVSDKFRAVSSRPDILETTLDGAFERLDPVR